MNSEDVNQAMQAERPDIDTSTVARAIRKSRWYGRVPIATTLAAAIGILVLLTSSIVFGVGVWLAQKNTFDLLSANAHQAITADLNQIEQQLQPAEHQARYIAGMISRGEVDPADRSKFGTLLIGSLAAVPQIEAVVFINSELESFGAGRDPRVGQANLSVMDNSDDMIIKNNMQAVLQGPLWLPPIWREQFQKTYMSRAHPVVFDGQFIGAVIAVVAVEQLSDFISMAGLETAGNRFILYGQEFVLAHWLMVDGYPQRSAESPLPALNRFGDPVLSSMWQIDDRAGLGLNLPEGTEGHSIEVSGQTYVFVYRRLEGYGSEPLIVGTYFQASDRPEEVKRMIAVLIAGLIALLLSLVAAIFLGRRIARPIVRFSSAAVRIRDLDVSKVKALPSSVFRELNEQSEAFNAMLRALRWFEFYVPKNIVEQLIRHGDIPESASDACEITVMFTDVVGFSAVSEGMMAEELAAFVNHHFSMVVECIEAEEGIVDKFMGDAVMAFWQESGEPGNSAERAARAAVAISAAIKQDNRLRQLQGKSAVGIRIGIHTGMATVGNIGAPGRLNYTIIGDTVNIGQRLEQLGKDIYPVGTEVSVLVSGDTAANLGKAFTTVSVGKHTLQGRASKVEVYKLE